jgi:hypothetical protein
VKHQVLESRVLGEFGRMSFLLYFLHPILAEYWLRMAMQRWGNIFPPSSVPTLSVVYPASWFIDQHGVWFKAGVTLGIAALCWVLQRLVVEGLLVKLAARLTNSSARAPLPEHGRKEYVEVPGFEETV